MGAGVVLLVARQLLTLCFAILGAAVGQLVFLGAPVAGAILGAILGAIVGEVSCVSSLPHWLFFKLPLFAACMQIVEVL